MSVDLYLPPMEAMSYLQENDLEKLRLSVSKSNIHIQTASTFRSSTQAHFEEAAKLLIAEAIRTSPSAHNTQKLIEKIELFARKHFGEASFETLRYHENSVLVTTSALQETKEATLEDVRTKLQNLFCGILKETCSLEESEVSFLHSCCDTMPCVLERANWINEQILNLRKEIEDCQKGFLEDLDKLRTANQSLSACILETSQLMTMADIQISLGFKKWREIYLPTLNFLRQAIEEKKLLEKRIENLNQMMLAQTRLPEYLEDLHKQFSDDFLKKEFTEAWPKPTQQDPEGASESSWNSFEEAPPNTQKFITALIENFRRVDTEITEKFATKRAELAQSIQQLRQIWGQTLEQALADNYLSDMSPGSIYKHTVEIRYNALCENILTLNKSPELLKRQAFDETIQKIKAT